MDNKAFWLNGPGIPPHVGPAPVPDPSVDEVLIQVKAVAVQPGEWKIQAGLIPIRLDYPAVIGVSLSGVVEKVGLGVDRFRIGDRVACNSTGTLRNDHRYGAYQQYCLAPQSLTSKIYDTAFEEAAATATAYGAFSALFVHLGLERPDLDALSSIERKETVLIWGASSSFGAAAIQIARKAGYSVVGVASGQHEALVSKLGASHFADRNAESVVDKVTCLGPFKAVLAAADSADDQVKIGSILSKLGGGHFLSTMGVRSGVELPAGVTGSFQQFLDDYLDSSHQEFARWVWWNALEDAFSKRWLNTVPLEVVGGLVQVADAWRALEAGQVSGKRLIILPGLNRD
ncbi:hypothetical protein NM208_g399 [Fusarium decemcellulare]|uniref:Uncharacterized protein n=2 Tax=Fusarium decemcellulare TaxID=57161 RepID=A0ACC1T011_9HYPO|nr:hypothetical protein NM208_g3910 [Fusarium decemcellulare]KAJ3549661.1 hypothetical protein NM208_g399 [Fusarium decemcellulare]